MLKCIQSINGMYDSRIIFPHGNWTDYHPWIKKKSSYHTTG